jgi:hypothetical protein
MPAERVKRWFGEDRTRRRQSITASTKRRREERSEETGEGRDKSEQRTLGGQAAGSRADRCSGHLHQCGLVAATSGCDPQGTGPGGRIQEGRAYKLCFWLLLCTSPRLARFALFGAVGLAVCRHRHSGGRKAQACQR